MKVTIEFTLPFPHDTDAEVQRLITGVTRWVTDTRMYPVGVAAFVTKTLHSGLDKYEVVP